MNAFLTTLALFLGIAIQAALPTVPFIGIRLELLPAVVAYAALTLSPAGALTLAFIAGLMEDSLSAGPFGPTAFVYALVALWLVNLREAVHRDLPPIQMAGGAVAATSASVVACAFAGITFGAIFKILILGILSAAITPFLFFVLDGLRDLGRRSRYS